jgi:membrane protein YdbS with pleckstrin-like domain
MADPRRPPPPPADDDTAFLGRASVPSWVDLDDEPGGPEPPDPPRIDPEELAGLRPVEVQQARIRRVLPLTDEPSTLVARYLFPTERYRGEWRRHVIHLSTPISVGVGATIMFGLGSGLMQSYLSLPWLVTLAILTWLIVMAWVAWQIAYWHFDRFILTNKRVMSIHGIITRHVAMMPLLRVTDMKYEQSPLGRVLNYGTFVIESAGQDQALREIPYLPNPNELYLRVVEEMYDPGAVEARLDEPGGAADDERDPGADA